MADAVILKLESRINNLYSAPMLKQPLMHCTRKRKITVQKHRSCDQDRANVSAEHSVLSCQQDKQHIFICLEFCRVATMHPCCDRDHVLYLEDSVRYIRLTIDSC